MERAQDAVVWLGPQGDPLVVMIEGRAVFVSAGLGFDQDDAMALFDEMGAAEYYQLRRASSNPTNERAAAHTAEVLAAIRGRRPRP